MIILYHEHNAMVWNSVSRSSGIEWARHVALRGQEVRTEFGRDLFKDSGRDRRITLRWRVLVR
jgi:hypothetical protein